MERIKSVKKAYLIFLLSVVSLNINAQDDKYLPKKINGHQILTYDHFIISYNEKHEQPDWVAYELTKAEVELTGTRCNCFAKDDNVTTGSATLGDYKNTGFDRGHLAASADFYMSDDDNRLTYLMSNMSPQTPPFNQGIWGDLEDWVREKALEYEKIYIITGPIFKNNLGTIGKNEVTIPGYFFKALLRFDSNGKAKTIGFVLPNLGAVGELKDYAVPVNLIETLTGLDLFENLPSSIENIVESKYAASSWGLN